MYLLGENVMKVLSIKEVNQYLESLDDWQIDGEAIKREWIFKDFTEAIDFINMIAVIAENHNHHPEIFNVYNRVSLRFNTHDAGGITEKDINIAKEINKL
jgi:4a-hydroxytetrahydrobiopterin dehydratase